MMATCSECGRFGEHFCRAVIEIWIPAKQYQTESQTFNIGEGGEFATPQQAFDVADSLRRAGQRYELEMYPAGRRPWFNRSPS